MIKRRRRKIKDTTEAAHAYIARRRRRRKMKKEEYPHNDALYMYTFNKNKVALKVVCNLPFKMMIALFVLCNGRRTRTLLSVLRT